MLSYSLPSKVLYIRNWTFIFSLPPTQAIGLTLVGLGAWLEIEEQSIQAVINQQQLLFGPYIIIAVGCIIVLIAFIGMVGACCDNKLNRFLLGLVSAPKRYTPSPLTHHLTPSHLNFYLSLPSHLTHTHPHISHIHTLTHTYTPSHLIHTLTSHTCTPSHLTHAHPPQQYIALVLLAFAAQLVGGILGFVYRDRVCANIHRC